MRGNGAPTIRVAYAGIGEAVTETLALHLGALLAVVGITTVGARKVSHAVPAFGLLLVLTYGAGLLLEWFSFGFAAIGTITVALAASAFALPEATVSQVTQALGRYRLPIFTLSVLTLTTIVHIYLPITTFLTSPGELNLHLNYLLGHNLERTVLFLYVALAVYGLGMFSRVRTVLTTAAFGALIACVLYILVVPFGYPVMNGLLFEQIPLTRSALLLRAAADLVLVPIAIMASVWGLLRWGGRPLLLSVAMVHGAFALAAGMGAAKHPSETASPSSSQSTVLRPIRFTRHGSNVLLLFLDRFMGGFVEDILEGDPELYERLSGFTWYPRTVSSGINSIAGLHPLLGGYDYTPQEMSARGQPLRDTSAEAFSILPANFIRKGWEAGILNPHGLGFTVEGDCDFLRAPGARCSHTPGTVVQRTAKELGFSLTELSRADYAEFLVLLGAMRATPYLAKHTIGERGPWLEFLNHTSGTTFRQWAELRALPELSTTDATANQLNIVFNMLPHEPYFMGDDCLPHASQLSVTPAELGERGHASLFALQHAVATRCTLGLVADYMDWLRAEGVYDNTKIVIVSDHGINGPVWDSSSRAVEGQTGSDFYVGPRSVLFVKPPHAEGPLAISEVFTPNAEVPRILCEEIGGCTNPFLKERAIETAGRDDPFYVSIVPWNFTGQHPNAFQVDARYKLTGKDPYNAKNWSQIPAE